MSIAKRLARTMSTSEQGLSLGDGSIGDVYYLFNTFPSLTNVLP